MFKKMIIGVLGISASAYIGKIGINMFSELMAYKIFNIISRLDFMNEFFDLDEKTQKELMLEIFLFLVLNRFDVRSTVKNIMA